MSVPVNSSKEKVLDIEDKQLGQLLRAMRLTAGKRQEEVAKAIRIGRTSICNMESGRQAVTLLHLVKAGDICGFDVRLTVRRKKK